MGARKHIKAEERKAALKTQYFAKLKGCPSSPRKMRYVVDMIRGMEVNRALGVLRFSKKAAAADVEKLLRSAIANWEAKNDRKAEDGELYVTRVFVDEGVTLADAIATALRCRSHSLHCNTLVDEDAGDEQLTILCLTVIFGFPVGNGRAEEFLYISCCCLLRETKHTQCAIYFHTADHVHDIAHLTG